MKTHTPMLATQPAVETAPSVDDLIRFDQLTAVRRSVLMSLPVNILIGSISLVVAIKAGKGSTGAIWFVALLAINISRFVLCRLPLPALATERTDIAPFMTVARTLLLHRLLALVSGMVWAGVALLCDWYTSPETLFYLTIVCGITAGAVTYGLAYAPVPISVVVPPLLSVAAALMAYGDLEKKGLAAIVFLYLISLVRGSLESQKLVRTASRLKNEARAMADSLEIAHERTSLIAKEMRYRADHDALTGALNRSGFMAGAQQAACDHSRLCLLLLDLDGFKAINDSFGHYVGDNVLIEVARRLQRSVPDTYLIARLGGDEFAVLYPCDLSDAGHLPLAQSLIEAVAQPFDFLDAGRIGVSIGIHVAQAVAIDEMLACADVALYAAKHAGRNRFHFFDAVLRSRLEMKRDVERDLTKALAEGALQVWYQPIMRGGGSDLDSLEALVRWSHPKHGWISPTDIIEIAALAGLSEPLFLFILNDVCEMIERLDRRRPGATRVAMNVSQREMSQIAIDHLVLAELKARNLNPCLLEIEITEQTAMDVKTVQSKLNVLSKAGVSLAIDDFGVGYSSLGSLRELRTDRVKIDRGFVCGLEASSKNQVLVLAILNLGRSLGFDVVAEGVETESDRNTLRGLGCDLMQGYYFARPMTPADAMLWIDDHGSDQAGLADQVMLPDHRRPLKTAARAR